MNSWSYNYHFRWPSLYPKCNIKQNKLQSPINIDQDNITNECGMKCELRIKYKPSKCFVTNTNNTVIIRYEPGSFVGLNNVWYELKKAEIHLDSCHTFNGQHFEMEIDLYHCLDDNCSTGLAFAIFVNSGPEYGKAPYFFSQFIYDCPRSESRVERQIEVSPDWNIADIFPENRTYYMYEGSLPYPPCSGNWKWIVFSQPSVIGTSVYNMLKHNIVVKRGKNRRPIQPDGGRTITRVGNNWVKVFGETNVKPPRIIDGKIVPKINYHEEATGSLFDNDSAYVKFTRIFIRNKERIKNYLLLVIVVLYFILSVKLTKYLVKHDMINKWIGAYGDKAKKGSNTSANNTNNTNNSNNTNNLKNINNLKNVNKPGTPGAPTI